MRARHRDGRSAARCASRIQRSCRLIVRIAVLLAIVAGSGLTVIDAAAGAQPAGSPALGGAASPALPSAGVGQPLKVSEQGATTTITVTTAHLVVNDYSTVLYVVVVSSPVTLRGLGTVSLTDNGVPIPGCQNLPLPPFPPYIVYCTDTYDKIGPDVIIATYSGNFIDASGSTSSPLRIEVVPPRIPHGYWLVAADGGVFTFGNCQFYGSMGSTHINKPVVGMAVTPDSRGYWLVASDGGVFSFGDAKFHGSLGSTRIRLPIVGIAATADGGGYWLVDASGRIFAFGDAKYYGSMGGQSFNGLVTSMAPSPTGTGYWQVATDGAVFAFGSAQLYGAMVGRLLNQHVVGMASSPTGHGYWLDASDGGVFAFGNANFYGSMGRTPLNEPMVGMAPVPNGVGYWLDASDGGVFAFGDAIYYGSMGGRPLNKPMVGMATMRTGFPGNFPQPSLRPGAHRGSAKRPRR